MERAVAYYRVSPKRQQRSGLGIDAQRATVTQFAEAEGISIVRDSTELSRKSGNYLFIGGNYARSAVRASTARLL